MTDLSTMSEFSTCDLVDSRPELQCCETPLRSYGGRPMFTGTVTSVSCLNDNLVVHNLLEEPGHGKVLVIDGHGSMAVALMGDRVASIAARHGWAGLIINGAVRDTLALARVDIGLLALGSVPRRAGKTGVSALDVPVAFGGVTFQPGRTVWCDRDGVVVEPPVG